MPIPSRSLCDRTASGLPAHTHTTPTLPVHSHSLHRDLRLSCMPARYPRCSMRRPAPPSRLSLPVHQGHDDTLQRLPTKASPSHVSTPSANVCECSSTDAQRCGLAIWRLPWWMAIDTNTACRSAASPPPILPVFFGPPSRDPLARVSNFGTSPASCICSRRCKRLLQTSPAVWAARLSSGLPQPPDPRCHRSDARSQDIS